MEYDELWQQVMGGNKHIFTITEIQELKVGVCLEKETHHAVRVEFRISLSFGWGKTVYKYSMIDIEDFKTFMNHILPTLRFDKKEGIFIHNLDTLQGLPEAYKYQRTHYSSQKNYDHLISTKLSVETEYNTCSVCLDSTKSTTICNHHLCHNCEGQLKKACCPECRRDLYSEDSDDE